ncbi:MAG: ribosome biogenesis GTP-binding protein YihA/YsxC [Desulfobaccales bacterium]
MAIPKIISADYLLSVHRMEQLPVGELPEVAFLGRSNVGKSSLINVLLGRKKLVRTSAQPGCTRALNFFLVNRRWHFVDLPGFGYAAVSKELKARWGQLVLDYLGRRQVLAAVVFLQDGRRRLGPEELFLWGYLRDRKRLVIPVLTKADKLKQGERRRQLQHLADNLAPLGVAPGEFIWFSALSREGREDLWARLLRPLGG